MAEVVPLVVTGKRLEGSGRLEAGPWVCPIHTLLKRETDPGTAKGAASHFLTQAFSTVPFLLCAALAPSDKAGNVFSVSFCSKYFLISPGSSSLTFRLFKGVYIVSKYLGFGGGRPFCC